MANDVASKLLRGTLGVLGTPWTAIQYYGKTGTLDGFSEVNSARIDAFVGGEYGDIGENSADLGKGVARIFEDGSKAVTNNASKTFFAIGLCVAAFILYKLNK